MDLSDCSRLLYHWAISPYVENIVSSEERQVGVTCQNCQSPLAVETKSKCHHYRSTNCISEHLKRRWYNGQHSCLPSSWSGFDSRPTQFSFFVFSKKSSGNWTWATWVRAMSPNHYTKTDTLNCVTELFTHTHILSWPWECLAIGLSLSHWLSCWLVGLGVWFSLRVREVPGSNPGRAHYFLGTEMFWHWTKSVYETLPWFIPQVITEVLWCNG